MNNNITIKSINIHDNYTIDINLSNNQYFVLDMKQYLHYPIFKKLQQLSFFKQAKFKEDVLYWDDMHDFPLHCMEIPLAILR